jgi:acetyltransferase-like isoleucine patch superfamily enzyme
MQYISIPFFGANDEEAYISKWLIEDGEVVKKGQLLANIETTKTNIEFESPDNGYIYKIKEEAKNFIADEPIAILSNNPIKNIKEAASELLRKESMSGEVSLKITKKAEILLNRNNININELQINGGTIDEKYVLNYIQSKEENRNRLGFSNLKKIGIIGGVAGGGALIVIDALLNSKSATPAFIFERDKRWYGDSILGVPVVGGLEKLYPLVANRDIDAVIIGFNRNLHERDDLYQSLSLKGVPFCNVIDGTVTIRRLVNIGLGNVILGDSYIGAGCKIGNNNFISANVHLEHGNFLGDSNAFGPGVFTSGNVNIGNRVRFGTGVFIEPDRSIEDDVTISSGSIVTIDLKKGSILKKLHRR